MPQWTPRVREGETVARGASRALLLRYGIIVVSIAALLLTNHAISLTIMQRGTNDETLLASSAGQRMLSQRILYRALRYSEYHSPSDLAALRRDIENFERNHLALLRAARETPSIHAIYSPGTPKGLDAMSRHYSESARAIAAPGNGSGAASGHLGTIEMLGRGPLIDGLNRATLGFQERARDRTDTLRQAATAVMLLSFAALLIEFLVIIRPLNRWLVNMVRRLTHQANMDPLTGLLNRRRFRLLLTRAIAECPEDCDVALVAADLDGFKAVNDALGHPAGDTLLHRVGLMLRTAAENTPARRQPLVARLGGDEFIICFVLPRATAESTIRAFGSEMIRSLAAPIPIVSELGEEQCIVSMSLGFAMAGRADAAPDTLISDADIALYASKFYGRGQITAFRPELRAQAERRLRLETDIRHAVLNGEFIPYYQPQLNMIDGTLAGVEMLARWQHPQKGLIPPRDFVSQAEEMGLSDLIEAALIMRALEDVQSLGKQGLTVPKLSVNASANTLRDPEFVDNLLAVTTMYGIPPGAVAIEVLETMLIENEEDTAVDSIRRLASSGFGTVIDDFGTGYSSLSAISGLALDGLKIDRSLVMQYTRPRGDKLLRGTVSMAHSMGFLVTAEGIETADAYSAMRRMGCDIAQGYHISIPLSQEQLAVWIAAHDPEEFRTVQETGSGWQVEPPPGEKARR